MWNLIGLTVLLFVAGAVQGQPSSLVEHRSGFWLEPGIDERGYFVSLHYTQVMPKMDVRPVPGALLIRVAQRAAGGGGYFAGQMSRRLPLPPDADVTGLVREDYPGRVVLRIPRFTTGPSTRR